MRKLNNRFRQRVAERKVDLRTNRSYRRWNYRGTQEGVAIFQRGKYYKTFAPDNGSSTLSVSENGRNKVLRFGRVR